MKIKDIIIKETPDYIIINKPSGLLVHPSDHTKKQQAKGIKLDETLADLVFKAYPEMRDVGELSEEDEKLNSKNQTVDSDSFLLDGDIEESVVSEEPVLRPGIVHRLDRETSGVMIIARTHNMFAYLKACFKKHTIKKTYRAFLAGWVTDGLGVIEVAIGRSPNDIRTWTAGRGARGEPREAKTRYRVIARFLGDDGVKYSYVEAYPETGRTHQLRVHFRYINHPIIGDGLYAPAHKAALGFDRVALHAYRLVFSLADKTEMVYMAPLPPDFLAAEKVAFREEM